VPDRPLEHPSRRNTAGPAAPTTSTEETTTTSSTSASTTTLAEETTTTTSSSDSTSTVPEESTTTTSPESTTTLPEETTTTSTSPEESTTTSTTTTVVNSVPVANDDLFTMLRTTASLSGNVLSNDIDPDGNPIAVVSLSNNITDFGTFSLNWADGSFTYQLDTDNPTIRGLGPGSFLDHTILYRITDGLASDLGTVTIRIQGVGDPPV
jgi:VCBS repeat-containing protein